MAEQGTVLRATAETVTVRLARGTACGQCAAGCAQSCAQEIFVEAHNHCQAQPGDRVEIELEADAFLQAALLAYGLPCAALLAGIALGAWAAPEAWQEPAAFATGLACAGLAYWGLSRKKFRQKPRAVRRVGDG